MRIACLALFALAVSALEADGSLAVQSWSVGTLVSDSVGQQGAGFSTVANPFQNSHTASYLQSYATASYDFSWTGDEASFGVTVNHHLEQLQGETITSGRIFIRPSVDSFITLEGMWQYAWPSAVIGNTSLSLRVWDLETETILARATANGGNVGIGPPFGSFDLFDSASIVAGRDYMLSYTASILHINPTPLGTFGRGEGSLNFTITPVPEPAALAMWVLPILLIRRRTRSVPLRPS